MQGSDKISSMYSLCSLSYLTTCRKVVHCYESSLHYGAVVCFCFFMFCEVVAFLNLWMVMGLSFGSWPGTYILTCFLFVFYCSSGGKLYLNALWRHFLQFNFSLSFLSSYLISTFNNNDFCWLGTLNWLSFSEFKLQGQGWFEGIRLTYMSSYTLASFCPLKITTPIIICLSAYFPDKRPLEVVWIITLSSKAGSSMCYAKTS